VALTELLKRFSSHSACDEIVDLLEKDSKAKISCGGLAGSSKSLALRITLPSST